MERSAIISQYPSICWNCKNSTHTPTIEKGNVGCVMVLKILKDNPYMEEEAAWQKAFKGIKGKGMYKGWIHHRPPFANAKKYRGIMTNLQPLLNGVTYCPNYQPLDYVRVIPNK